MHNSAPTENSRVNIRVHGRVQGVGFRYFVLQQALSLDLTGWTRNLADATVEILAEGRHTHLLSFIEKVRQGPPTSSVTKLDVDWDAATAEFSHFEIVR